MRTKKKAARSRQRTARTLQKFQSPFYAPSINKSSLMFEGFASSVPGPRGFLVAYGTIETKQTHLGDYAVMFDARTVIGTEGVIRNTDGRERCTVTLRNSREQTTRINLDASRDVIEAAVLKARA
jgi:hypothetical protein